MTAMSFDRDEPGLRLTEAQKKRRRARSLALAAVLGALVILFYVLTIARMGQNVVTPPM
jgi:hypothetical protein